MRTVVVVVWQEDGIEVEWEKAQGDFLGQWTHCFDWSVDYMHVKILLSSTLKICAFYLYNYTSIF